MPIDGGLDGWLVIDKPPGLTSNRVVGIVRRATGAKAGHAGTLDPLATGVLPVALGAATKTVRFAMSGRKCYRFAVRWGVARSTDDGEGEIVGLSAMRPARAAIEAVLPRFTGSILQTPPAYSAIKFGGRRAYALARAGVAFELGARTVEIDWLRLTGMPDPDHAEFEASVGKGTYIRTLVRDLARALGTFGHVVSLRRTAVGPFTEMQAISLETVALCRHSNKTREHLLPIETVLDDIPAVSLAAADAVRLRWGQFVTPCDADRRALVGRLESGSVVAAWRDRDLIALARIENGGLRPMRVFNCGRGRADVDYS